MNRDYGTWKLTLEVDPFNGYSGAYTQAVMEELETQIRRYLDNEIGYLNSNSERNYSITREDWEPQ